MQDAPPAAGRTLPIVALIVVAALGTWFAWRGIAPADETGPGSEGAQGPGAEDTLPPASLADTLARDRVVALVSKEDFGRARRVLEPLVAREGAELTDLVTAAVLELKDSELDAARGFVERAGALDAEAAAVHYLAGRIAHLEGELELAAESYRAALAARPDDLPSKYLLASVLKEEDETLDGALVLFREIEAVGMDHGGPWYVSTIYQLYQLHDWILEDEAGAQRYGDLWQTMQLAGLRAVKEQELHEGELARLRPPAAIGNLAAAAVRVPALRAEAPILPELGGGDELLAVDLDGDRQTDLVSAGTGGLHVALRTEDGGWRTMELSGGHARLVRAIDLHKDDSLDLVFFHGPQLVLLEAEGLQGADEWLPSPLALPVLPSPPADLELVDFDHDGDLDLFLVGDFGGVLLRNDGAAQLFDEAGEPLPRGGFVDASADAGLPTDAGWSWCAVEDIDSDQDVDLLMGGPDRLWVGSSLRGGRFEDVAEARMPAADYADEPLLADVDGDARVDMLLPGSPGQLALQGADGRLRLAALERDVPRTPLVEVDLDLDGTLDVVWAAPGATAGALFAVSLDQQTAASLGEGAGAGPLAVTDLESGYDTQLAWELLRLGPDGVHVSRLDTPASAVRVKFKGVKDNRQGIGAVVELRAGELYRRHFWRGQSMLYGLGEKEFFDVVRVTWPNGVVQHEVELEKGNQILDGVGMEQPEGLIGSCPFLYTWNGVTFEFISDVLGITPLGLPMAPGVLVPPDHDEYVLVRGEQLVPDDAGQLVLQFTEELREVTYLDNVRLDAVDHPLGTEVQPNERFCFPPFPVAHTHVMAEPLPARRATGSDGEDWTNALAAIDDVHAVPFVPLADRQFLGLAHPHWLELEFDPEELQHPGPLRLVCTGWFYWTDASVNVAAARTPGVEFVPPILSVPGEGGWIPTGPPVGFPAGKTKTMVLDVTDVLRRDDPRLRISSTLRLYWDSIRLAVGDDGEQRTTSLEPTGARLWPRGFSAPQLCLDDELPERFVWDELAELPRWNQHPGRYTRFGETLPLVTAVDDMYVIMGSGDALTVTFDGTGLPPLPDGWRRDWLVYLDGWAKDRDPNTVEALEVEPLPFHGMSGYPYGADEGFPDTPAHRAWRAEWNTRPAYQHVVPLAPSRMAEWANGE